MVMMPFVGMVVIRRVMVCSRSLFTLMIGRSTMLLIAQPVHHAGQGHLAACEGLQQLIEKLHKRVVLHIAEHLGKGVVACGICTCVNSALLGYEDLRYILSLSYNFFSKFVAIAVSRRHCRTKLVRQVRVQNPRLLQSIQRPYSLLRAPASFNQFIVGSFRRTGQVGIAYVLLTYRCSQCGHAGCCEIRCDLGVVRFLDRWRSFCFCHFITLYIVIFPLLSKQCKL